MDKDNVRFCAQCLDDIESQNVAAYCKQCQEFVCSNSCLKQHAKFKLTKNHSYLLDEELKQASGRLSVIHENSNSAGTDDTTETTYTQANLRTVYNVRHKQDKEMCSIHASVVLKSGNIIVADLKNKNLKLFDTTQRQCTAVLEVKNGPRDICLSNHVENELYLIENGIKCIHVVNTDDLTLVRDIPTTGECFGVCCWKDGIAVSTKLYKNYHGQYAIQLLNYKGKVVRNFITSNNKTLEFNLPWYLASDITGQRVVFTDYGNNTLTCIDVDAGMVFVYKDPELIRPVSVIIDTSGDIFIVGQRSHNVHHLSCDGHKQSVIHSETTMEFPGGISYDSDRNLFYIQCVGWSDTIQLFDLTPYSARGK